MKKKLIATLLTASLLVPTPVYAGTEEVPVTAHITESYTVTLPTSITLNNTKEQTYGVTVKGDILYTTTISVEPDATFTLQRQNSSNMTTTASVTQESTDWSAEEINADGGTTKEGTISIDELRAGEWEGELHFNISLSTSVRPGLYNSEDQLVIPWSQLVADEYIRIYGKSLLHGSNTSNLKGQLVIPEGITAIGEAAFNGCNKLTEVTIPSTVTTISSSAFAKSGLSSIVIPESVTAIPDNLFYNCTNLRSVTIPNSVTTIGGGAFYGCTSLTSITIPNSVTTIGEGAFYGCTNLSSVTIPRSVTAIRTNAFYNVPHIYYTGSATSGKPWGALALN